jgi:SNF2 family DNA or RNA helicase
MELYDFQKVGVDRLTTSERLFLADEMGTGKTVQAIAAAEALGAKKVLIVCQNSMKGMIKNGKVIGGWAEEISLWAPGKSIGVVEGQPKQRHAILDLDPDYLVINYEALVGKTGIELTSRLVKQWDVVIFDEHHKIKNRNAKATKACKRICKYAEHVWMLSGTPLLNHAQEMWPPLNMMFPEDKKYRSYWRWVRENCIVERGTFGWTVTSITDPKHPRAKKLRDDLQPLMLRRTKAEVLKDMPAKTIKKVWVELHGEQLEAYREMEKDMLAHFEDELITVAAVIAQIIRLKQITVGPELMFPEMDTITGAKYNALVDILEADPDKKLIIFSQFRTALERVAKRLYTDGICELGEFALLTGNVPQSDRSVLVNAFQKEEYPRILLITTQAGGTGLTLTAASTAVFLDKLWTPAMNVQAQDRIHRIGQSEPVTILELLALDSVEERIEGTLRFKQHLFDYLIESEEALKARGGMVKYEKLTGRQLLEELYGNS